MVFVRYIVEAMARREDVRATLVTSRRARDCTWLAAAGDDLRRSLTVAVVEEPRPTVGLPHKFARQFGHSRALRRTVAAIAAREPVDEVFVPFLDDYVLYPFALTPRPWAGLGWSGIAIRPRFHLRAMGADVPPRPADRIEALGYRGLLRSRTLRTMFTIDPLLPRGLGDPRVLAVCDPADLDPHPDPASLGARQDAVVLLVYGYVDERKAIDRLLRAAADPRMPAALTLALVGEQDEAARAALAGAAATSLRAQGRLIEVARRVDDREEASAFARADIVWSYYPGSYCSSGAMVRAGRTGRALLTTSQGLAGALTRRYGSGLTAPEHDDAALLQQLKTLVEDAALRDRLGQAGRRHFKSATGVSFGDAIVARLAARSDKARR